MGMERWRRGGDGEEWRGNGIDIAAAGENAGGMYLLYAIEMSRPFVQLT